eukprot:597254_1
MYWCIFNKYIYTDITHLTHRKPKLHRTMTMHTITKRRATRRAKKVKKTTTQIFTSGKLSEIVANKKHKMLYILCLLIHLYGNDSALDDRTKMSEIKRVAGKVFNQTFAARVSPTDYPFLDKASGTIAVPRTINDQAVIAHVVKIADPSHLEEIERCFQNKKCPNKSKDESDYASDSSIELMPKSEPQVSGAKRKWSDTDLNDSYDDVPYKKVKLDMSPRNSCFINSSVMCENEQYGGAYSPDDDEPNTPSFSSFDTSSNTLNDNSQMRPNVLSIVANDTIKNEPSNTSLDTSSNRLNHNGMDHCMDIDVDPYHAIRGACRSCNLSPTILIWPE